MTLTLKGREAKMKLVTNKTIRKKIIKEWRKGFLEPDNKAVAKCCNCIRFDKKKKQLEVYKYLADGEIRYFLKCKNIICEGGILSTDNNELDPLIGIFD